MNDKRRIIAALAAITGAAFLLQAVCTLACRADAPPIDWQKAQTLWNKRNANQPLTADEQAYLNRAIAARETAAAAGPAGLPGPNSATGGAADAPLPLAPSLFTRQAAPTPSDYSADENLDAKPLWPAPKLGRAGSVLADPDFGSRILRVTQNDTIASPPNQSYYTPASSWQNTWNSNSTLFYVMAQSGFYIPFQFDPATFQATRIQDPANPSGALVLHFRRDPNFSFTDPAIIYGMSPDLKLDQYNFRTNAYTTLLDLAGLVPRMSGMDTDGVSSSEDDEIVVAFNGPGQDRLSTVLWFNKRSGARRLLDLSNATIDGKPANFPVGPGGAHHACIAKGGRYVDIINQGVGNMIWDTATGACTMIAAEPSAHGAGGYGAWINYDTLPGGSGQGWLTRTLDPKGLNDPRPVMPNTPSLWGDSHPSWNNAGRDRQTPIVTSVYDRVYKPGDTRLGPLIGEIVAVSTDGSGKIWRFARHRSVINSGTTLAGGMDFWSTPRGNISQDGRYFLFDSNWEDTLGTDPRGGYRKDVFVLELKPKG